MQQSQTYSSLQVFLDSLKENCLLLARHGESDWNSIDLIQGQQDRPLSPEGFNQRKNLFFLLQSVPIARIFTSALQRTIQTAIPISDDKKIPLEKMPELNEAKLGIFEGQNRSFPSDEFSKKMYRSFLDDEINVILPGGGENLKMVDKRIAKPVAIFLDAVSSGHILIVGHRNVNKMIMRTILGLSFNDGYRVEHENNCLYVFEPKSQKAFFLSIENPGAFIKIEQGYVKIGMTS
ncbi:histidine phosphatase family protein [candidate division KSB1 bacterium]|nr:histidine phosphatase family protein [candidate division KSB1 bacterium]